VETLRFDIQARDFSGAGAASRALKQHLKRIGAESDAVRRAMIAAYEAEMNVVIHADGGVLEATVAEHQVDVDVTDGGPGIPDVPAAMREGFSTASAEARALGFGAGLGLPNIARNSDRLRVTSAGPNVHSLAARDDRYSAYQYNVLLWNFSGSSVPVELVLKDVPGRLTAKPIVLDAATPSNDEITRLRPESSFDLKPDQPTVRASLEPYGVRFWSFEKH